MSFWDKLYHDLRKIAGFEHTDGTWNSGDREVTGAPRTIGGDDTAINDTYRKLMGQESYDTEQRRLERERFNKDYRGKTGAEPRYPYMQGFKGESIGGSDFQTYLEGTGTGHIPMSKLYGGMR